MMNTIFAKRIHCSLRVFTRPSAIVDLDGVEYCIPPHTVQKSSELCNGSGSRETFADPTSLREHATAVGC